MKKDYIDDPEGYFQTKKEIEEQETIDFHKYWEKYHPNEVPGQSRPIIPYEE